MHLRIAPWILALSALLAPAHAALQAPGQDEGASEAHYTIQARVDDSRELQGQLTLRWVNRSGEAVQDLWFHLHLNAYSNTHSNHLWQSDGLLRGVRMERGFGFQEVTALTVGEADLMPSLQHVVTPDGLDSDRTVFKVDLPAPVASGEEVEVQLTWTSRLPRVRRRTGVHEDFIFLSHWFPKLGVYEAGRGWNCHQFHMNSEFYADYGTYDVTLDLPDRYAKLSEGQKGFDFKGGASGVMVGEPRVEGGRVRVQFHAPSEADRAYEDPNTAGGSGLGPQVHGFAWTADPEYVVRTGRFVYDEWAERYQTEVQATALALKRDLDGLRLRDVDVTVLIQPEREEQWERHFDATCAALFFYGLWWGEYPYEHVTVVDPAWGARAAGGMEYPTLFTCGTQLFTEVEMHRPESVTVHEAGHQFWYGLVGNNEYEAAWMDEGFNSFTDAEVLYRHYGSRRATTWYSGLPQWGTAPTPATGGGPLLDALSARRWRIPLSESLLGTDALTLEPLRLSPFIEWWRDQPRLSFVEERTDPRWGDRASFLRDPNTDPIETWAFRYADRTSYSVNSYPRTAVALRSLIGVVGHEAFHRGMRHYADSWRYRHPYPADFYAAFQEGAEVDVQWYFDEVFRDTVMLDWNVSASQRRAPALKGWVRGADGVWREAVTLQEVPEPEVPEEGAAAPEDETLAVEGEQPPAEGEPERPWLYDVVLRRDGELCLPVDVLVTFADGETQTHRWTREAQQKNAWWRLPLAPGGARIQSVVVDPKRLYYLDLDMSDNQWYAEPDELRTLRWSERAFTRGALLLDWASSIGG